ncbi:MAG TPA: cysteine desulfurase family protein [Gemmatimonadales bacterium]|nr:cysteine desulfurase family protein [Gemmatimonadales bacterium]
MPSAVYLDHAATTPVRPEARDAMLPYLGAEAFGNPSSPHRFGRAARAGLEQARRQVAAAVGAEPAQVLFTSGGTEADNLAVLGLALAMRHRGELAHVATPGTEHKAVLAAAHAVAVFDGRETLLPVGRDGLLDLAALDEALAAPAAERPTLVSVMWVNNETGVVQPIGEIARRCRAAGVRFHTDAVQAFGNRALGFRELDCDLLSVSAHKIGGPKGVGALVAREPKLLEPLIHGGGQQGGVRPGTENIAGAVGFGAAAELAARERPAHVARLAALRARLRDALVAAVPDASVTVDGDASRDMQAPHILSLCVPGADSEALLMHMDLAGVAVSSGSACTTGAVEPSHVLTAMGVPRELAIGAIRFSLGRATTDADVNSAAAVFPEVVAKVRALAGVLGR